MPTIEKPKPKSRALFIGEVPEPHRWTTASSGPKPPNASTDPKLLPTASTHPKRLPTASDLPPVKLVPDGVEA